MTDPRATPSSSATGSLPRWRIARPGRPVSGLGVWAARTPAAALALGAALIAVAVVWPLERPAPSEPLHPHDAPRIALGRMGVADREKALASLTAKNIFNADGRFWAPKVAQTPEDGDPDSPDGPGASDPKGAPASGAPAGAPTPVLTNAADMPADIRPAFENLRLIGVRSGATGDPLAIIALVQNLQVTSEYTPGSEFIDDKFPQAAWRIVAIDVARDRVTLDRSGRRVSLALYPAEPVPVARTPEADTPPAATSGAGIAVVAATPEQVAQELRAAGITDAEIDLLMRLMREDPDAFAAARADAKNNADKQDQPAGLDAVLRLMQEATDKKKDPPPPPPPPGA